MNSTTVKRIKYFIYCIFHRSSYEHANYLKKHSIFKSIGESCRFQPYMIPSDAAHIILHNNVGIGSGVLLLGHDAVHKVLNNMYDENDNKIPVTKSVKRRAEGIEIFNNVQIGANSIVCPGVQIGPNAIVSAGSVVTKDVPPDTIVAGNPARIVGSFSVIERMRRGEIADTGDVVIESSEDKNIDLIEKEVIRILEEHIDGIDIRTETAIVDDKLIDSLGLISVVTALEENFRFKIPFQVINASNFNSARKIAALISNLTSYEPASRSAGTLSVAKGEPIELKDEETKKPVVQRILENAAKQPEHIAIIANDKETTYQELANMICSIAHWMRSLGIKERDCVVVQALHADICIACYYAIHLIGGILVPVEKTATKSRILEIANETVARHIICIDPGQPSDGGCTWYSYEFVKTVSHERHYNPAEDIAYPSIDLPCEMIFTTGTTGKSKGVLIAQRNMSWYANAVAQRVEMKTGNRFFLTTPLNHAGGLRRTHLLLANGCCIVYLDGLSDLGKYFEYIEKYRVTSLYLPPVAIRILLSRTGDELSRFKDQIDFVYSSSSPLPVGDCEALRKVLPNTRLYNAYEASETPGVSAYDYNRPGFIGNCLGPANSGTELAVLLENGQITTEPDVQGQICVKGRMNMLEYYREPALTESVMKDGWFVSNDLGWLDADGQLYLSGRKGDVINIGGYKIAPTDVEETALLSGLISECICIEDFDEYEVPYLKLLVVTENTEFEPKSLGAFLGERLETYKLPRKIEVTDAIKKTFNGKIDRKAYRRGIS